MTPRPAVQSRLFRPGLPFDQVPAVHAGALPAERDAWKKVKRSLGDRQRAVLRVLKLAGRRGLTGSEIAAELAVEHNWISGRITELGRAQYVLATHARRATPGGTGTVFVHVDFRGDRDDVRTDWPMPIRNAT